MKIKDQIIELIIFLLSKLNRTYKKDFLNKLENLIYLANGKRKRYDILHEVKIAKSLIEKYCDKSNGYIIDVGSHNSDFSYPIFESFPQYNYILFEPQIEFYTNSINRFANKKNVKIYNFGLFSKNIKKKF